MIVGVSTYKPFPAQMRFHSDPRKFRLFGGARGPGKSRAILEEGIAACNFIPDGKGGSVYRENAEGLNALVLRTSLTDLEGSVISKFKESDWFKKGVAKWSDQKKTATFPNGSMLKFGYAANSVDLAQYLGQEYAFIGWDEIGLAKDYKMFVELMGSLRCPIPDVVCRMAGSANPGGVGHAWLKAMFVDGKPAPGMEPHQYKREHYSYIPATYLDGPYKDDQPYLDNLLMQPKAVQRAWILGDWNIVAGAYFDCWSMIDDPSADPPQIDMTFDPLWLESERKSWWDVWISIDWGFQHHAAVYWYTLDSHGNCYTFREIVVKKQGSRALAKAIIENSRDLSIDAIYLSPDAKSKHDYDANSIKQQMDDIFLDSDLPCTTIASDDRKAGWLLMHQMLSSGQWKIGRNCREALAGLPTLMINPANIEDVLKVDAIADDVGDALRYGIFSRRASFSVKPRAVRRQETLAAAPNMQAMYMADLRLKEQEEKKAKQFSNIGRIPSWRAKLSMGRNRQARRFFKAVEDLTKDKADVDKP
jgi:phage terminase large subunit